MSNNSRQGDIEDAVLHAKNKYHYDIDLQAQFLKNCIEIIKRDHGDEVMTSQFEIEGHNFVVTGFASGGKCYFWWEMFDSFNLVAVGLEKSDTGFTNKQLLFCSDSNLNDPIVLNLYKG